MKQQNFDRAVIVTHCDPNAGTAAQSDNAVIYGQNQQDHGYQQQHQQPPISKADKFKQMQQAPQRLQNPIPVNPKGLPPKQNPPMVAPKGMPSNVPTFDVSDLEKKSPEELDALLRQMDDYAQ